MGLNSSNTANWCMQNNIEEQNMINQITFFLYIPICEANNE